MREITSPTPINRESLISDLSNIANGIFVEYADLPGNGIQAAVEALQQRTDDPRIIRESLLKSFYGSVESLNLHNLFTLF